MVAIYVPSMQPSRLTIQPQRYIETTSIHFSRMRPNVARPMQHPVMSGGYICLYQSTVEWPAFLIVFLNALHSETSRLLTTFDKITMPWDGVDAQWNVAGSVLCHQIKAQCDTLWTHPKAGTNGSCLEVTYKGFCCQLARIHCIEIHWNLGNCQQID